MGIILIWAAQQENHAFFEQTGDRNYASYINKWTEHIIAHHPEYWSAETGQLILPLPIEVMKSFCNANCHHENGKLMSQSTVNGYKSALKNLYKAEMRLTLWTQAIENEIEAFLTGYQMRIAAAKLDGTTH